MATARPILKDNEIERYQFMAYLGRDSAGRQIRKYCTWYPPKWARRAFLSALAQKEADKWEASLKAPVPILKVPETSPQQPTESKTDFSSFVNEMWLPIQVRGKNRKPKTVAFYEHVAGIITEYFKGKALQDINALDLERYAFPPFSLLKILEYVIESLLHGSFKAFLHSLEKNLFP